MVSIFFCHQQTIPKKQSKPFYYFLELIRIKDRIHPHKKIENPAAVLFHPVPNIVNFHSPSQPEDLQSDYQIKRITSVSRLIPLFFFSFIPKLSGDLSAGSFISTRKTLWGEDAEARTLGTNSPHPWFWLVVHQRPGAIGSRCLKLNGGISGHNLFLQLMRAFFSLSFSAEICHLVIRNTVWGLCL